jgi:uncharacterized protein YecE (DUF72 family)
MEMKGQIRIGTSGWHYAHWKGPFYPGDIKGAEMLEFYTDRFDTVEINSSFYHLPEKRILKAWRDISPRSFIFAVKASRYITHMKKLRDPQMVTRKFFSSIDVLDNNLGPILFQLPPKWKFNAERLEAFLDALPRRFKYAFEFRDTSWFNRRAYDLLADYGVAFCIYQLAGLISPKEVTASFVYVRLHGPTEKKYEGSYSPRDLSGWAGAFSAWARKGKDVYCYFDNDQAGYAARNASSLTTMLKIR